MYYPTMKSSASVLTWVLFILLSVGKSIGFTNSHLQLQRRQSTIGYRYDNLPLESAAMNTIYDSPTMDSDPPLEIKTKKSLYEILRASPNATRTELKVQYLLMARETHPDARIGKSDSLDTTVTFSEVSEAWKILSNPKYRRRYDRTLKAEEITEQIEKMADKMSKRAAPTVKLLHSLAAPFLRRTAVTAVASFSAAADDLRKDGTNVNFGRAAKQGIKAALAAGRIVKGMELWEKSQELEKRSLKVRDQAMKIQAQLSDVVDKRVHLALMIPNSWLSTSDAMKILDGLNTLDSVTILGKMLLQQSITSHVGKLDEAETVYFSKVDDHQSATQELDEVTQALQDAEWAAAAAIQAEIDARKALEQAVQRAIQTRQTVQTLASSRQQKQSTQFKTNSDLERSATALGRRQEVVRNALLAKAEANELRAKGDERTEKIMASIQGLGVSDLEQLTKEEKMLKAEYARIDEQANRLLSRSAKLRSRALVLDSTLTTTEL